MIRLHAKEGLLGEGEIHRQEIPYVEGLTARRVLEIAKAMPQLRDRPLGIAANGRLLSGRELDIALPDGAEVVVASPQDTVVDVLYFIGELILYAVAGAALSYVVNLLIPPPRPRGVAQERGDASSGTYAWDGIATNYGQGLPIPYVGGRMAVGGQVISTDLRVTTGVEVLRLVLALCEGPIHRIGDTIAGEQNDLGGSGGALPSEILVNGLSLLGNERVWIRSGSLNQSHLPPVFFPGASSVFLVGSALEFVGAEAFFPWETPAVATDIRFLIAFPTGFLIQTTSGTTVAAVARFEFYWRQQGAPAWNFAGAMDAAGSNTQYQSHQFDLTLPPNTVGPLELRVQRVNPSSPNPPGELIGIPVLRQVVIYQRELFSYPGIALIALQIIASSQNRGSLPQVQVRIDADLVRVWDESLGWSTPCWDVPAAPFNWMTHAPGRNPAWQAARLLLDKRWGLGRYFTEDDIDMPALRRWSILCDQEPNPGDPWGEAAFQCDYVADSPRPAWERLLSICSAGRCSPVPLGRKITFVYQYRDAHSDSLVSVPAKSTTQLFTSTNVEDFSIRWMERSGRPTAIHYQFLNAAKNFAQDVLPVEDVESTVADVNNPIADDLNVEVVQSYSVTRESQLLREGMFAHRLRRKTQYEVSFRTGTWSLACRVGDLIAVEHEVLRPFSADVPMSAVVEASGVATTAMIIGHVVVGTGLRVVFRNPDGAPVEVAISSLTALGGGRTQLNLASPQSFVAGVPAVIGQVAKLTLTCLVVDISLEQDLRRQVRAVQWDPSVFDPIGPDFFNDPPEEPASLAGDRAFVATLEAQASGGHVVSYEPDGSGRMHARVWVSLEGVDRWVLLGESRNGMVETRALAPHTTYRVAVCLDQGRGVFSGPESVTPVTLTAPEFPRQALPTIRTLTIDPVDTGLRFRWPAYGHVDLAYYELRAGSTWITGKPIYRGQLEEVTVDRPPAATTFMVAVRSTSGLYGEPAITTIAAWEPPEKAAFASNDELDTTPAGTLTNLSYDAGLKRLTIVSDDEILGAYEALELDAGYVAPWEWRVEHDTTVYDDFTCGEETGLCGDGEARWATCAFRPPSTALPGVAFDDVLVGDDIGLCGDDAPFDACGGSGELGELVSTKLESRAHDGSTWSDWTAHADGVVVSQKLQVRTRIERASPRVHVAVTKLVTNGYL